MRCHGLVLLVLSAACGDPAHDAAPPQLEVPAITKALTVTPAPARPPVAPVEFRPQRLMSGGHGHPIASVALSEDGKAAVTIDTTNRVRLWPALDASRDPWVVPVAAPGRIAIQRDGETFVLGTLDAAGGIVVQRIEDGTLVAQVTFEPAYDDLIAATGGFLAIRADQTIVQLDGRGKQGASVRPEPGERVATLSHRNGKTLALLASRAGVRGRWLTDAVAWGDATALLPIEATSAVLSPAHTHIAGLHAKSNRPVVVELATGRTTELWLARWDLARVVPLGFVGPDRVAVQLSDFELSTISWWDLRGNLRGEIGTDFELELVSVADSAVGDGRVVSFLDRELVLVAPSSVRYLGYRVTSAKRVRPSPGGLVAGIGGVPTLLDDGLRAMRPLAVPTLAPKGWSDVVPLDGDRAIVIDSAVAGRFGEEWLDETLVPRQQRPARLELVDLTARTKLQTIPFSPRGNRIAFEPATQLVAARGGSQVFFARLDPALGKFGAPTTVALGAAAGEVALVDPALAGGVAAIAVANVRGGIELWRIRADELVAGSTLRAAAPVTMTGELEAIDRAGNIYLRETPDVVTIHAADRELAQLGDLKGWALRPSPDGTRVAAFGRGRVVLRATDGTELWAIAVPGVTDVQWSSAGELVATVRGLARIDATDGQLIAGQCGWGLAIRRTVPVDLVAAPSICDR